MTKRLRALAAAALALALAGCAWAQGVAPLEPAATAPPAAPSPTAGPTATAQAPLYTVAADEYLSLRVSADTGAACLAQLPTGTRVRVLAVEGPFAHVIVEETGQRGYVLLGYLTPGEAPAPPEEDPSPQAGRLYAAQVREFLSLRVAPDGGAERILKLPPGALLLVLDNEDGFARVRDAATGARGYVMADYLVLSDEEAGDIVFPGEKTGPHAVICREFVSLREDADGGAAVLATLPPGARVHVRGHEGAYARATTATGEAGYILAQYLTPANPAPAAETAVYTVVCEEFLSLRTAPDTAATVIRRLLRGETVELLSRQGAFARVKAGGGQTGYVLFEYLLPGEEPSLAGSGGRYAVRCQEFLTLRERAATSAPAVTRLRPGEGVTVKSFSGLFARVQTDDGLTGWVLAGYLVPAEQDGTLAALSIVKPAARYSYEQMTEDLAALERKYPGQLTVESVGVTAQGRSIPVAILGDREADIHILLQAGIHGREHMTTLLAMAQLEYCLARPGDPFADGTVGGWMDGVCLHIIPMVNPDGVAISQRGTMTAALQAIYETDLARGLTDLAPGDYLRAWKANAAGVDLNRNFDAGWANIEGPPGPSYSRYKGAVPEDQPETAALAAYTRRYDFAATLSYHAHGSCLYWHYGGNKAVNDASRDLARAVLACTGYPLLGEDGLDAGGYKDWAMEKLGLPSVTVEIGTQPSPLPLDEFYTVWARNRMVPAAVARWAQGRAKG